MSQELVRQRLTQRHAGYQPEVNELLVHTYVMIVIDILEANILHSGFYV